MQAASDSLRLNKTSGFGAELEAILSMFKVESDGGCTKCADGYILDLNNKPVAQCECMPLRKAAELEPWKKAETEKLIQAMLPRYDLRKTVKKPWYDKIPLGSCWLWGRSQEGKTHAIGWALARQIKQAQSSFRWVRVKAPALALALDNMKRWDDPWGDKGRALIDQIDEADAINFEEIDKFGNFTEARWVLFFNIIDEALEKGKVVRVSSQFSIAHIVQNIVANVKKEAEAKERDGVAPSETRFYELMKGAEIQV
mgnify:CR=1 FL=1